MWAASYPPASGLSLWPRRKAVPCWILGAEQRSFLPKSKKQVSRVLTMCLTSAACPVSGVYKTC